MARLLLAEQKQSGPDLSLGAIGEIGRALLVQRDPTAPHSKQPKNAAIHSGLFSPQKMTRSPFLSARFKLARELAGRPREPRVDQRVTRKPR